MSTSIGVIEGTLRLNDLLTPQLNKAGKSLLDSGKSIKAMGDNMSQLGTKITVGITLPILAIAGAATSVATSFESSFTGVRKTVEATEEQFAELSGELRRLARDEIPLTVDGLNRIAETGGQLGIATENIISFTDTIAAIGVSTVLTVEKAAVGFARLANITGLPQTKFENLGSSIVELGNNLATMEDEILDFSLRIAGAASAANVTEPQILGIAAAFTSVGVQAEAGGTATQKVFIAMLEAVAKGGPKLEQFAKTSGLTASGFVTAFEKDAAGAFTSFVEGLGSDAKKSFTVLENLELMDQRLIRAFTALGGAGDLLSDSIEMSSAAFVKNTALAFEASKRYATFESQLTLFWNRIKDVGITLGTALLPVLKDMLDLLSPLVSLLGNVAELFAKLPAPIKLVAIALVGLLAAAGPVLFVAGQLLSAWGALSAFIPTLIIGLTSLKVTLLAFAANPLVLAIAGVVALGVALNHLINVSIKNSNKAMAEMTKSTEEMVKGWKATSQALNSVSFAIKESRLEELKEKLDKVNRSLLHSKFETESLREQYKFMNKEVDLTTGEFKKLGDRAVKLKSEQLQLRQDTKLLEKSIEKLGKETGRTADKVGDFDKVITFAADSVKELKKSFEDQLIAIRSMSKAYDAGIGTIKDINTVISAGVSINDAMFKSLVKQAEEVRLAQDAWEAYKSSIKGYGSQAEGITDVFTNLSNGIFANTEQVEKNHEGYELLKRTFDVVGLSGMELVTLTRDLSRGLAEDAISSDQFAAAMERLENRTEEVSSSFISMSKIINKRFVTLILNSNSFADGIRNISTAANVSTIKDFLSRFTSGFEAAIASGEGLRASLSAAMDAAGGVAVGISAIASALANTDDKSQRLAANMINTMAQLASGNYVGAIISFAMVLVDLFSDSQRSINEVRESFNNLVDSIIAGEDAVTNMGQALVDFKELAARDGAAASKEFGENFSKIIDSVLDDIENLRIGMVSTLEVFSGLRFVEGLVNEMLYGNLSAPEIEFQLRKVRNTFFEVMNDMNQFLVDQSVSILEGLTTAFGDFATSSAKDIAFAEASMLQAFGAMSKAGMSFIEIADSLGDMIVNIGDRGVELGITFSDEFSRMGEMMAILARDEVQELIKGFDGVAQSVQAIGNMGLLTAEQVDFFGDSARKVYNKLIAQGLTTAEAIATMGPQWQVLNDLQAMYGFTLDASTQGLLDMAIAQGVVTETGLTSNDILINGFTAMLDALNELIRVLGGIPILFEAIGEAASNAGDVINDMSPPPEAPAGGGDRPGGGSGGGIGNIVAGLNMAIIGFDLLGEAASNTLSFIAMAANTTAVNLARLPPLLLPGGPIGMPLPLPLPPGGPISTPLPLPPGFGPVGSPQPGGFTVGDVDTSDTDDTSNTDDNQLEWWRWRNNFSPTSGSLSSGEIPQSQVSTIVTALSSGFGDVVEQHILLRDMLESIHQNEVLMGTQANLQGN